VKTKIQRIYGSTDEADYIESV